MTKKKLTGSQLAALKALAQQKAEDNPDVLFPLKEILFKQQLEFVLDPARVTVACCSRRAGKSIAVAALLIYNSIKMKEVKNLYITITRGSARDIIWGELLKLLRDFHLYDDVHIDNQRMRITFWNRSEIIISGAKDTTEIEKLRGNKYYTAVIDEAQSFKPYLDYLIREILRPALRDYQGKLLLTGTPKGVFSGAFYDACHNNKKFRKASVHHWTIKDNIKFPAFATGLITYEEMVEEELEEEGITESDAAFQRETLGKWVKDDSANVYNLPSTSLINELPAEVVEWRYILAYDTGFRDDDAFTILAYSPDHLSAYIIDSHNLPTVYDEDGNVRDKTYSDVVSHIRDLQSMYNFTKIVFDPTEAGHKTATEIRQRYKIRMEAVQKINKLANIRFMNDDLRKGALKVIESSTEDLRFQWDNLTWQEKADGTRVPGTKIGGVKLDHLADSALYGWRTCRHYLSSEKPSEPDYGTVEYFKKEEEARLKEWCDKIKKKQMEQQAQARNSIATRNY